MYRNINTRWCHRQFPLFQRWIGHAPAESVHKVPGKEKVRIQNKELRRQMSSSHKCLSAIGFQRSECYDAGSEGLANSPWSYFGQNSSGVNGVSTPSKLVSI